MGDIGNLHADARRAMIAHEGRISGVEGVEVVHVGNEDRHLGDAGHGKIAGVKHGLHVRQGLGGLFAHVLADDLAGRIKVAKCNVDDNQDIAMKYGVMSIPTLVMLKGGKEAMRTVGAMPKARLMAELEKAL